MFLLVISETNKKNSLIYRHRRKLENKRAVTGIYPLLPVSETTLNKKIIAILIKKKKNNK